MILTLAELIIPPLIVFTTLFGLLARGDPKPGGVALFLRVGLVGLALGAGLFYLVEKTAVLAGRPALAVNAYRGLGGGGALLVAFAIFGIFLQKRDR
jgi:hypothetical protein